MISLFLVLVLASALFGCQSAVPTSGPAGGVPTLGAATAPPSGSTAVAPTAPATAPAPTETLAPGQTELVLVTHDSFAASESVVQQFEKANNARVRILKSGDAGAMINKEILAGPGNPLGDALYGVDNTFLSRALKAGIFEPYAAAGSDQIPNQFRVAPQNEVTPVDYADVCVNYDIGWLKQKNLPVPQALEDLAKPQYKSLLVVENPATSSPGLAFLLATVAHFGQDKYLDYWKQLRANDVAVSDGWDDAFNNRFTLSGKGDRPLVVSYATDPAAEVYFSNGKLTEPPNGIVQNDESCFREIEFAGVLKGARHPDLAKKWIDFMLSPTFQSDMPAQMFVYPVNPQAKLPDFFQWAVQLHSYATMGPDVIDANRDKWINAWIQAVLR